MSLPIRLVTLAASLAIASSPAGPALAQEQPAPFAGEIAEFAVRDQVRRPQPCGLLFVGSSSIRMWVGLEADFAGESPIQRGFGGSQTEHANLYFDRLVAQYRPARIVLYEGENDLDAGKSVDQVEADLAAFMERKTATLGSTPVYFIAVKPSPARWAQFERQSALNERMRAMAAMRDDLVFVDVVTGMLDGIDGTPNPNLFIGDRLHMNEHGYAIWRKRVLDAIRTAPASEAPHCISIH